MNIYIEANSIFKNRSGIGQFTKRLSETMALKYPEHSFTFFSFRLWPKPLPAQEITGPNVRYRFIRFVPGRVYNLLFRMGIQLPIDVLLRQGPDVIVYPNFIRWPVLNHRTKTIVMIHDLSFVYFPQFASPINRRDNERFVPKSISKADRIITISQSSKRQIIEHFKVSPEKISIVYPAVDTSFFYERSLTEVDKIRRKYKLPKKYMMFSGTLEPRKNITGLLTAYENLDQKITEQYALVLAGGKGWQDEEISEQIDKLTSQGLDIILTGYVPDVDLPAIYTGASLFVWPSHYEGFGIPLLEAMACGVPVITSDNSSLPEVAGKAAVLVDSNDTAGISSAIQRVLNNESLQKELVAQGNKQIQKFTWDKSAEQFEDALSKL